MIITVTILAKNFPTKVFFENKTHHFGIKRLFGEENHHYDLVIIIITITIFGIYVILQSTWVFFGKDGSNVINLMKHPDAYDYYHYHL